MSRSTLPHPNYSARDTDSVPGLETVRQFLELWKLTGTTRGLSLRVARPETPRGQGAQTLGVDLELRGGRQ